MIGRIYEADDRRAAVRALHGAELRRLIRRAHQAGGEGRAMPKYRQSPWEANGALVRCVVCLRPLRPDHQCDPATEAVIEGCRRRETDGRQPSEAERLAEGFRMLRQAGDDP